jgi:hypothetical protein
MMRAAIDCAYTTCPDATPELSVSNFYIQVNDLPLALRAVTQWLTEVRQNPESEFGAAAGGEIPDEQQGKRPLPARRSPAIRPEWGWCDPGTGIATNLG